MELFWLIILPLILRLQPVKPLWLAGYNRQRVAVMGTPKTSLTTDLADDLLGESIFK